MNVDLTHGSIFRGLLRFSLPLMAGNLLQQLYNLVDTFVVGRYCGEIALAAVGSAFSVMILLTSIVTGLCMLRSHRDISKHSRSILDISMVK